MLCLGNMAHALVKLCNNFTGYALNTSDVAVYPGVVNAGVCCKLCTLMPAHICKAWTIQDGACHLKADLSFQVKVKGAISGYTSAARTHYGNPAEGCLPDELPWRAFEINGTFCAPRCLDPPDPSSGDPTPLGGCVEDKPLAVEASPACMLEDPVGLGRWHCALHCREDAECAESARCDTTYGADVGICVYSDYKL